MRVTDAQTELAIHCAVLFILVAALYPSGGLVIKLANEAIRGATSTPTPMLYEALAASIALTILIAILIAIEWRYRPPQETP